MGRESQTADLDEASVLELEISRSFFKFDLTLQPIVWLSFVFYIQGKPPVLQSISLLR